MKKICVCLIDDDVAIRDSIALLIQVGGMEIYTFPSGEEFLSKYKDLHIDCIILDLNMPDIKGMELFWRIKKLGLRFPVIFLTGYGDIPTAVTAVKEGAYDFLNKPIDGQVLLNRIKDAVEDHEPQMDENQTYKLPSTVFNTLTEREKEVMKLVLRGFTSKEIGQTLKISFRTVELHRSHIMHKFGASNIAELVRIASA